VDLCLLGDAPTPRLAAMRPPLAECRVPSAAEGPQWPHQQSRCFWRPNASPRPTHSPRRAQPAHCHQPAAHCRRASSLPPLAMTDLPPLLPSLARRTSREHERALAGEALASQLAFAPAIHEVAGVQRLIHRCAMKQNRLSRGDCRADSLHAGPPPASQMDEAGAACVEQEEAKVLGVRH